MNDHSFCQALLRTVRAHAKEAGIPVPALTTYKTGRGQYQVFVKGGGDGPFVSAHCSFDAKAKYISRLIPESDEQDAQLVRIAHTPGPWEVDSGMVQTVAEHDCKTPGCGVRVPIAYMDRKPGNGTLPVERDANAQLISAAPDLLDAARTVLARVNHTNIHTPIEDMRSTWELLKKAIDKAEGRKVRS